MEHDKQELRCKAARQELLHALFKGGGAANLFVVLRNGELLPDDISGSDLDVSTLPGITPEQIVKFITERASALGWIPLGISRRPHMSGFSIVSLKEESTVNVIHFDVFDGISAFGIPLLSPALLASESCVRDGVRGLSKRGRVLATVLHHLCWSGGWVKEKYSVELAAVLENPRERDWLVKEVCRAVGNRAVETLMDINRACTLSTPCLRRRLSVLLCLLRKRTRERLLETLSSIGGYYIGQLPSVVHPSGMVGCPGDKISGLSDKEISVAIACRVALHGFGAPGVRARSRQVRTLNGPHYERFILRMWSRWTPVRWIAPSLFLWLLAKQNRFVVMDRLPIGIRLLRASKYRPSWIAEPNDRT